MPCSECSVELHHLFRLVFRVNEEQNELAGELNFKEKILNFKFNFKLFLEKKLIKKLKKLILNYFRKINFRKIND